MSLSVRARRERRARVGVTAVFIVVALLFVSPLVWAVATSLKAFPEIYSYPPRLMGASLRWSNYTQIWSDYPIVQWLVNSILVCTAVVVAQVLTSSAAGFAFAKLRFPHRDKWFLVYIGGLLIPNQVLLIPLFQIIKHLGLINSPLALVIPALAGPFGTFLFRQFYMSVSDEYIDAARIDGASLLRVYWSIFLPISRGVIGGFSVITFMATWNSFLWPLVVLRTPTRYTATLGLSTVAGGDPFRVPWQIVMSTGITLMLPVLLVFVFAQRHVAQGLSMSGYTGK
jgi:multiple sugar transport system permease protein